MATIKIWFEINIEREHELLEKGKYASDYEPTSENIKLFEKVDLSYYDKNLNDCIEVKNYFNTEEEALAKFEELLNLEYSPISYKTTYTIIKKFKYES